MFLPNDYVAPKAASAYMKIADGENKIRILSSPIIGWEDWTKENKPIRFHYDKKPEKPITEAKPIRHFWSFIVWNYNEQRIQVLHLTQASIRGALEDLNNDKDWGAPYFYDIKIIKSGKDLKTKYTINPLPHRPVDQYIIDEFYAKPINLQAILNNEDPFASHWKNYTAGVFTRDDVKEKKVAVSISELQAKELMAILAECDQQHKDAVWKYLHDLKITKLEDMPAALYDQIKVKSLKKREEYLKSKEEQDNLPF